MYRILKRLLLSLPIQPILLSLRRGQASVSYAQSLVGAPETHLTALDNGLRVASEETGHATCTVRMFTAI